MRICFFAPISNYHTKKWCNWFASRGHEVHAITFDNEIIDGIIVHRLRLGASTESSDFRKLEYLFCRNQAHKILRDIKPDIVNAHYATSYGSLAALACEGRYILSVWGSDIYSFPRKSRFHRALVEFSLARASWLFSTSNAMAEEAMRYTNKPFTITPFGVDASLFKPRPRCHGGAFVVSIVKTLSAKYGIDVLLEAVAEVSRRRPDIPLKVRIAGKGPEEMALKGFAHELGLDGMVEWLGFIDQQQAAKVWADADVGVIPSVSESFGVAAVEAQACGTPVIVSDVPGLMESTLPGVSSLVFPRGDAHALAQVIINLYDDVDLRLEMGWRGVAYVGENFEIDKCFESVERLFEEFTKIA